MLLEAETNKYCPGGYDIGAISNLITWVLNFFLSVRGMLGLENSGKGPQCKVEYSHYMLGLQLQRI